MESLPEFKYHPDPVATGSVRADQDTPCLSCNRIRGYVYQGPAFSEKFHYLSGCICPWCIADGSAAKRFGATFTDTVMMDGVSREVCDEIETRTPGYTGWQQEEWLACCGDAAAYLGSAGAKELKTTFADAMPAVRDTVREEYDLTGKDLDEFLAGLSRDDQPTAYIFRCLHCKRYVAAVDQT